LTTTTKTAATICSFDDRLLVSDLGQRLQGSLSYPLELGHERVLEDSPDAGPECRLGVVGQSTP